MLYFCSFYAHSAHSAHTAGCPYRTYSRVPIPHIQPGSPTRTYSLVHRPAHTAGCPFPHTAGCPFPHTAGCQYTTVCREPGIPQCAGSRVYHRVYIGVYTAGYTHPTTPPWVHLLPGMPPPGTVQHAPRVLSGKRMSPGLNLGRNPWVERLMRLLSPFPVMIGVQLCAESLRLSGEN